MPLKIIPNDESSLTKGEKQLLNMMNIMTYHSAKGLENKIAILLNVDSIHEKKLLYVGTTRASEKLYIHSSSFSRGVGKDLKALA